jgi:DNA-binding transcriptional ArsR family regulator
MTEPTTRFSIVPLVVTLDKRLGHAAKIVLVLLSSYADKDGWAWPKQSVLAEQLDLSVPTINEHLQKLAALGYIEVRQRAEDGGGARVRNMYRLVYDKYGADRNDDPDGPERRFGRAEPPIRPVLNGDKEAAELAAHAGPTVVSGTDQTNKTKRTDSVPKGTVGAKAAEQRRPGTRYGLFIDAVRELGLEYATNGRDATAINLSDHDPVQIARAYHALLQHKWGPDWLQKGPTLTSMIPAMNSWLNRRGKQYEVTGQVVNMDRPVSEDERRRVMDELEC